jgi:alpha-beta hydrolase superfamily lysophospholipase
MNRQFRNMLLAIAMLLPTFASAAVANAASTATTLLDRLDAGKFDDAVAEFGPEMKSAVPAEKLRQVWASLPAQFGTATGRGEAEISEQGGATLVQIRLHYAHGELVAKVALGADGKIIGFLIQPAPPPAAPAPAADASYREIDFAVGSGETSLPGTLALPNGEGPFPAVVLVHGSGPQDRDETIGANRPFLDIARGLAEHGIAVLRYEKRTKVRPQDYADGKYTVDDETTNDAVAAVAALSNAPSIDPKRIYVLGHSQGGLMAPRVAARSGHVAGLILLAAPARPILDLLSEQNHHLAKLDGKVSPEEQQFLDDLDHRIARVRSGGDVPVTDTPMNLPAAYWRSVDSVDPIAEAKPLRQPMLLLQGGRDMQVVDADWQRWQSAYGHDSRATFKHYPALNHLAIAGSGPGTVAEYNTPGHVDATLIADLAAWINAH